MNHWKNLLFLAVLLLITMSCLNAQQDSLNFPAPQYMLPFYDHYSRNNLNVEAMGRGFTTNALTGGVENAVNNPASLDVKKAALWMELAIKPPIREINKSNNQMYSSPVPFGLIGVHGRLYKGLEGAISYSMPKSLLYDDFSVEIDQGNDYVTRYPTYNLHQFTATLAGELGNFRMGLNLHNQLHSFQDIVVYQTFDRIDRTYYILRLQPGIIYNRDKLQIGLAVTPPVSKEMDIKYATYDVTLPLQVKSGIAAEFANNRISADVEWEQFSQMSDRFDDRITLKAGYEKRVRDFTYRAGLMSLPGVFKGAYRLPVYDSELASTQWWGAVDRGGIIGDTGQLFVTAGFTYHFKGGKLVMGVMRDVLDKVPTTLFSMAIGFNLDTLKGKKFLIFDK